MDSNNKSHKQSYTFTFTYLINSIKRYEKTTLLTYASNQADAMQNAIQDLKSLLSIYNKINQQHDDLFILSIKQKPNCYKNDPQGIRVSIDKSIESQTEQSDFYFIVTYLEVATNKIRSRTITLKNTNQLNAIKNALTQFNSFNMKSHAKNKNVILIGIEPKLSLYDL